MAKTYCIAIILLICSSRVLGGSENYATEKQNFRRNQMSNYVGKTQGEPWPLPQVYSRTSRRLYLTSTFAFHADVTCAILDDAFSRYMSDIGPLDDSTCQTREDDGTASVTPLRQLNVKLATPCHDLDYPTSSMCENYTLSVSQSSDVATLTACSIWGALRGMETFRHLLVAYLDAPRCQLLNETNIVDYPRFAHRGLMLDTSRHYLDMMSIYQSIEALVQNRMNVLHWHIVDDQSFPYQSSSFPPLVEGAFTQRHIYTIDNVLSVIEFARLRGVRVIPEFDTPGHTQSWGVAYPQLLVPCYSGGKPNGNLGPMDPSTDNTFVFVAQLFSELARIFPDAYFHMGGDEVDFSCWKSNPNITAFMTKMGFGSDYTKLENYYIQKVLPHVTVNQKIGVLWQEIFDDGVQLPTDQVIVHVWKDGWEKELANVTAKGYTTLLSSPFYFNYISYGNDWQNAYKVEPLSFNGTAQQYALVIGGEACMWGEYVDSSNVLTRTWPRAAAFAERFWSSKDTRDINYATARLEEQRCRMIKRGLAVEPVSGPGYCDFEPKPCFSRQAANLNEQRPRPQSYRNTYNYNQRPIDRANGIL